METDNKQKDLFGEVVETNLLLRDRFQEPPFTILNTKSADWQNRKRRWINLGLKSEEGRDENMAYAVSCQSGAVYELRNKMRAENGGVDPTWEEISAECERTGKKMMTGTSIFDPCLTELMYRWFCPTGGRILDCFAGGSVRGVVAHYLGYNYSGLELRQRQVDANRENALLILPVDNQPQWYVGDSDKTLDTPFEEKFDLLFSCPPYADLEVYSDDPDDLSNMDYDKFLEKYRSIIKKSCAQLKNNSFAVFVVGDLRDKRGVYKCFHHDTVRAFQDAGMDFYNEAVVLTAIASAAILAGRQFSAGRKLTKIHQNVYCFYKGDHSQIKNRLPVL